MPSERPAFAGLAMNADIGAYPSDDSREVDDPVGSQG
jgi:hypothetical protein